MAARDPRAATKKKTLMIDSDPLPDMSAAERSLLGKLGDYELLGELGRGGMGAVYKARHTTMDRVVAVKLLPADKLTDASRIARFKREMKATAGIDHPNVVRAFDAREIDGTHLLVMEYVDGITLHEVIHRLGPLPVADACEIVRQTALGLQAAHEEGLVHRDVKPANLMLTRRGQVKLLDLGLARFHAPQSEDLAVTAIGMALGTPDFMAPEQITDGASVDIRADIYGLGCTLFMLLAGRPPFCGKQYGTAFEKLSGHLHESVPPVARFRSGLPEGLNELVGTMTAKEPGDRHAQPADVVAELERFCRGSNLVGLLESAEKGSAADTVANVSDVRLATNRGQTKPRAETKRNAPHVAKPMSSAKNRWWWLIAVIAISIPAVWLSVERWVGNGDDSVEHTRRNGGENDIQTPESTKGSNDAPAAFPAVGRDWIVLTWAPPGDTYPSLWLFSPDGKTRRPVANPEDAFDTEPVFSPSGRRIAFVRVVPKKERSSICIYELATERLLQVVSATGEGERFVSPVWLSETRLGYTRDPRRDATPDIEFWRVDVPLPSSREVSKPPPLAPRLVFRIADVLDDGAGVVTAASPDGEQLLLVAQRVGERGSADVFVVEKTGNRIATIWEDEQEEHMDARAVWSPLGGRIAWQHNFIDPEPARIARIGVGIALWRDGRWESRLDSPRDEVLLPIAFAPDDQALLCMRVRGERGQLPILRLVLVSEEFEQIRTMFEIPGSRAMLTQRHVGRLGDWARVPSDVRPSSGE
jgi:serine/threonine protein kinase